MSDRLGIYSELELTAAKSLVRELVRALRGVRLYQENHPTLEGMVTSLRKRWEAATAAGPLALRLTESAVMLEDVIVYRGSSRSDVLPCQLYDHGVAGFILKRGLEPEEAKRLVHALPREPDSEGADYALLLWEADLTHLQVLLDADQHEEEALDSPEEFARQVVAIGEDSDPPADGKRWVRWIDTPTNAADPELFRLTESEQASIDQLNDDSGYRDTLRHSLRVLHCMAYESLDPEEGMVVEHVTGLLVEHLCATGDLEGVTELLERSEAMRSDQGAIRCHFGEHTLATARENAVTTSLLDGLEKISYVAAGDLATALARLGYESALPFAQWLARTRHHEAAREAIQVLGHEAERVLVELYEASDAEKRSQLRPALIDLASHDSLAAVADEFDSLPEATRLQIVRLGDRSTTESIREAVARGLRDENARVRLAAIGAVRRVDAPAVARYLDEQLGNESFERRSPEELKQLFEMLGRVGDGAVATVLADLCRTKGLGARFKKPTTLQERCLAALRRMRSTEARAVVDVLYEQSPKSFRELLEDPFEGL
ncbi:MAG: HEAT repeat domain-containing protein [Planctomycetota bacterium]|jgi:hypothetical protein